MDECPRCHSENSFVVQDGRYSCKVCNFEDQRRVEYEMDTDCNFIDFTKTNTRLMTELKRSVRKSTRRTKADGPRKSRYVPLSEDAKIPRIPIGMFEKRYKVRVQPDEFDPPGDVLPRRHAEVETWKRVSHRLSTFTQLLARTTRFLVKEKRAGEKVKPVAMVIFRRLLASQGIAFSDREWTDVEENRYVLETKRYTTRVEFVSVAEQREEIATQIEVQNEGLRTGAGVGEEMWSMLMSDAVTENLQVKAPAINTEERMKKKRRYGQDCEVVRTETETAIDALVRGGVLMLNVELLVAVAYLACALVGSRVQMADLVRWYREARIALPPHFLHDLTKVKMCDDGKMVQLESCSYDRHFNFYLHECNSFLQRVMSATRVPRRRLSIKLDEIVASHLCHLNLPFALMERALVVLARARVDTVDLSIDQADEEGQYCNQNTCKFGMEEDRVHPMLSTAYRAPFVTFPADTRAMAVILLVLRLTFGLRDDRAFDLKKSSRFFNVGAWLRQLRARLRVYGGEDGATVVRESARESPKDYEVEWNMELNRVDLTQLYLKLTYRQSPRAAFPDGWNPLPKLDGDRFLYKDGLPFPEDGERNRAMPSRVAMKTPLIYHGERVREEAEKEGNAMEKSKELKEAFKLIGKSFKNLEIEEASEPLLASTRSMRRERREEGGEVAEEWKHLFPAAVNFEVARLPRLASSSLVKFNKQLNGRYMIGGGAGDIAFSFVSVAANLSRPHRFLIQAMSRLIVEAPAVIYAASTLLEMRMLRYQSCLSLVQNLESGGPVIVDGCAVSSRRKGTLAEAHLELRRAAGEARNIIDVSLHALARKPEAEIRNAKPKPKSAEFVNSDFDSSDEEREGAGDRRSEEVGDQRSEEVGDQRSEEVGDQRSADEGENGSENERESLVDEEIDEEEEEEEMNDDDLPELMMEELEEVNEEGVEIPEEESVERPCVRYRRALDIYKPVVQKKYYLNFEYLWSILAIRLW